MLFLISTPIGTLSDISLRAIETLRLCDYVLCEDTRRSRILLEHYAIHKPLESYYLEEEKLDKVIRDLKEGKTLGLLSDAGTPLICDPGQQLVQTCIKENISFTAIPGPTALVHALVLSGFPSIPFQFLGFAPRKQGEILHMLYLITSFPGTTIIYESPKRLVETLRIIANVHPSLEIAIARELTKTFEEVLRFNAKEAYQYFVHKEPLGEIVLLFRGHVDLFAYHTPETLVQELQTIYKLSLPEAIKSTAKLLGLAKQEVYKKFHL